MSARAEKNAKRTRNRFGYIGRIANLALVIVCLFFGTALIIGEHYWKKPISREEAIAAEAAYQSCEKRYGHYMVLQALQVRFSDLEQQYIDRAAATEALCDAVRALEPGTRLSLLLHPNSATILELRVGETVLLDFDRARSALRREVRDAAAVGVVMYLCGLYLAVCFFVPEDQRRKWSWRWRKMWG